MQPGPDYYSSASTAVTPLIAITEIVIMNRTDGACYIGIINHEDRDMLQNLAVRPAGVETLPPLSMFFYCPEYSFYCPVEIVLYIVFPNS